MYKQIQVLNKSTQLKLNPNAGYYFAGQENFCPVFLQELPQVIREYFVCFPNNQTDLPQAVLGLTRGKNMYVNDDGTWQADYVPAYMRRYPFVLARDKNNPTGKDFTLAVDADAPHLSLNTGAPLFTDEGKPTAILQDRITLLQAIEKEREITRKAVKEIEQAGLFTIQEMNVMAGDQKVAAISGLRMVDEKKLPELKLTPGHALEIVYAHLFSRVNLRYGVLADKKKPAPRAAEALAGFSFDDDILRFE